MFGGRRKKVEGIVQAARMLSGGMSFSGSKKNLVENGRVLLEESVSLFDGKINPIRCLSVDELNAITVDRDSVFHEDSYCKWYKGFWEGRRVLLKLFSPKKKLHYCCREIAVALQMGGHQNVHKLLGCCLETEHPVLIFEFLDNGCLYDRILGERNHINPPLGWKDRLRIAWEISHALAYLHTVFPRAIIHRDVKSRNVFLDRENVSKLSMFSLSVSVPLGKTHAEGEYPAGTWGYMAPECINASIWGEKADVYAFGMFLLVLLTGRCQTELILEDGGWKYSTRSSLKDRLVEKQITDFVDPGIMSADGEITAEDLQQRQESIDIASWCMSWEEDDRPTMEEVAAKLKSIIDLKAS